MGNVTIETTLDIFEDDWSYRVRQTDFGAVMLSYGEDGDEPRDGISITKGSLPHVIAALVRVGTEAGLLPAQGIAARSDGTAQPVQPEGQEPGPKDAPTLPSNSQD